MASDKWGKGTSLSFPFPDPPCPEIPSPSTGLDISSSNLSALITLIGNLELNAADAETLASALLLRSRAEAFIGSSGSQPTYPTAALCPVESWGFRIVVPRRVYTCHLIPLDPHLRGISRTASIDTSNAT
ncbi:hypothetical protein BKA82DRAFT_4011349 [Pisolithus tinctorius]|nr:hypothetical protein BKA82DRAFT_4011349 [Pisolithus tinctorius]